MRVLANGATSTCFIPAITGLPDSVITPSVSVKHWVVASQCSYCSLLSWLGKWGDPATIE